MGGVLAFPQDLAVESQSALGIGAFTKHPSNWFATSQDNAILFRDVVQGNLEAATHLDALWVDQNAIVDVVGRDLPRARSRRKVRSSPSPQPQSSKKQSLEHPTLQCLSARGNRISSLRGLVSSGLPSLTALDLDGNRVKSLSALRRLTSLVHVSLRRNLLGAQKQVRRDAAGETLSGLELLRLETVRLDSNSLRSLEPLARCTELRHLSAAHNLIASVPLLSRWPNLRLLDLSHNRVDTLDGIEDMHGLSVLKLRGNIVRSLAAVTRAIDLLPALEEMDLRDNPLTDGLYPFDASSVPEPSDSSRLFGLTADAFPASLRRPHDAFEEAWDTIPGRVLVRGVALSPDIRTRSRFPQDTRQPRQDDSPVEEGGELPRTVAGARLAYRSMVLTHASGASSLAVLDGRRVTAAERRKSLEVSHRLRLSGSRAKSVSEMSPQAQRTLNVRDLEDTTTPRAVEDTAPPPSRGASPDTVPPFATESVAERWTRWSPSADETVESKQGHLHKDDEDEAAWPRRELLSHLQRPRGVSPYRVWSASLFGRATLPWTPAPSAGHGRLKQPWATFGGKSTYHTGDDGRFGRVTTQTGPAREHPERPLVRPSPQRERNLRGRDAAKMIYGHDPADMNDRRPFEDERRQLASADVWAVAPPRPSPPWHLLEGRRTAHWSRVSRVASQELPGSAPGSAGALEPDSLEKGASVAIGTRSSPPMSSHSNAELQQRESASRSNAARGRSPARRPAHRSRRQLFDTARRNSVSSLSPSSLSARGRLNGVSRPRVPLGVQKRHMETIEIASIVSSQDRRQRTVDTETGTGVSGGRQSTGFYPEEQPERWTTYAEEAVTILPSSTIAAGEMTRPAGARLERAVQRSAMEWRRPSNTSSVGMQASGRPPQSAITSHSPSVVSAASTPPSLTRAKRLDIPMGPSEMATQPWPAAPPRRGPAGGQPSSSSGQRKSRLEAVVQRSRSRWSSQASSRTAEGAGAASVASGSTGSDGGSSRRRHIHPETGQVIVREERHEANQTAHQRSGSLQAGGSLRPGGESGSLESISTDSLPNLDGQVRERGSSPPRARPVARPRHSTERTATMPGHPIERTTTMPGHSIERTTTMPGHSTERTTTMSGHFIERTTTMPGPVSAQERPRSRGGPRGNAIERQDLKKQHSLPVEYAMSPGDAGATRHFGKYMQTSSARQQRGTPAMAVEPVAEPAVVGRRSVLSSTATTADVVSHWEYGTSYLHGTGRHDPSIADSVWEDVEVRSSSPPSQGIASAQSVRPLSFRAGGDILSRDNTTSRMSGESRAPARETPPPPGGRKGSLVVMTPDGAETTSRTTRSPPQSATERKRTQIASSSGNKSLWKASRSFSFASLSPHSHLSRSAQVPPPVEEPATAVIRQDLNAPSPGTVAPQATSEVAEIRAERAGSEESAVYGRSNASSASDGEGEAKRSGAQPVQSDSAFAGETGATASLCATVEEGAQDDGDDSEVVEASESSKALAGFTRPGSHFPRKNRGSSATDIQESRKDADAGAEEAMSDRDRFGSDDRPESPPLHCTDNTRESSSENGRRGSLRSRSMRAFRHSLKRMQTQVAAMCVGSDPLPRAPLRGSQSVGPTRNQVYAGGSGRSASSPPRQCGQSEEDGVQSLRGTWRSIADMAEAVEIAASAVLNGRLLRSSHRAEHHLTLAVPDDATESQVHRNPNKRATSGVFERSPQASMRGLVREKAGARKQRKTARAVSSGHVLLTKQSRDGGVKPNAQPRTRPRAVNPSSKPNYLRPTVSTMRRQAATDETIETKRPPNLRKRAARRRPWKAAQDSEGRDEATAPHATTDPDGVLPQSRVRPASPRVATSQAVAMAASAVEASVSAALAWGPSTERDAPSEAPATEAATDTTEEDAILALLGSASSSWMGRTLRMGESTRTHETGGSHFTPRTDDPRSSSTRIRGPYRGVAPLEHSISGAGELSDSAGHSDQQPTEWTTGASAALRALQHSLDSDSSASVPSSGV